MDTSLSHLFLSSFTKTRHFHSPTLLFPASPAPAIFLAKILHGTATARPQDYTPQRKSARGQLPRRLQALFLCQELPCKPGMSPPGLLRPRPEVARRIRPA